MFAKEELQIIFNVLSQLQFKPGQGGNLALVENILNKINGELEKAGEKKENGKATK